MRGVHGEKLVAVRNSDKLPSTDIPRIDEAIEVYDEWIKTLQESSYSSIEECINSMVMLLSTYKQYIDVSLIFDSREDYLYRQKGQLKLDNTVMEEFLPLLVKKCISLEFENCDLNIGAQVPTYSSTYFTSGISNPLVGGGMMIKTKDQDFSMSRTLYIKSSYNPSFASEQTMTIATHLGYILAELKTNLDKTMFQEASATAHDTKLAVTGAKYYLLCDFLDMTPISTATTDIDEILILRKAKRINSNIRKAFSTYEGRQKHRDWYVNYLVENPYSPIVFKRFIDHIFSQMRNEDLIEESVLDVGYF